MEKQIGRIGMASGLSLGWHEAITASELEDTSDTVPTLHRK
jgi:hypothetical protein